MDKEIRKLKRELRLKEKEIKKLKKIEERSIKNNYNEIGTQTEDFLKNEDISGTEKINKSYKPEQFNKPITNIRAISNNTTVTQKIPKTIRKMNKKKINAIELEANGEKNRIKSGTTLNLDKFRNLYVKVRHVSSFLLNISDLIKVNYKKRSNQEDSRLVINDKEYNIILNSKDNKTKFHFTYHKNIDKFVIKVNEEVIGDIEFNIPDKNYVISNTYIEQIIYNPW